MLISFIERTTAGRNPNLVVSISKVSLYVYWSHSNFWVCYFVCDGFHMHTELPSPTIHFQDPYAQCSYVPLSCVCTLSFHSCLSHTVPTAEKYSNSVAFNPISSIDLSILRVPTLSSEIPRQLEMVPIE